MQEKVGRPPMPLVIVAARPRAYERLRGMLAGSLELLPVDTLEKAQALLAMRDDARLLLITVSFDESRMFDLLRLSRARYPDLPVVCCRAFEVDVQKVSLEAIRIATETLGAAAFVDLPGLLARIGHKSCSEQLKEQVMTYLRPARVSST